MSATGITLTRVFRFGGRDLDDPSPDMTPAEVLRHYARLFPRMLGAKVIEPVLIPNMPASMPCLQRRSHAPPSSAPRKRDWKIYTSRRKK